jgi:DNA-binding beta-propeller fold protein YncE
LFRAGHGFRNRWRDQYEDRDCKCGCEPGAIAVDTATNKIYVSNQCGNDLNCQSLGTITVIDGATLNTSTVTVGYDPGRLAVDPLTHKIFVVNMCTAPGITICANNGPGTLTVIDGATLHTQNVTVGYAPADVAVNTRTNVIYVANITNSSNGPGTITVINGSNYSTRSINTGNDTYSVAVNESTNFLYATNLCGSNPNCQNGGTVTAINGATLGTQSVNVAFLPYWLAVNPVTNKIYVANDCNDSSCSSSPIVTVIDGGTLSTTGISVCTAGVSAADIEVDAATNTIYFPCDNAGGSVTIIDGANNQTSSVAVGNFPDAVAINSSTNDIYVPNSTDNTVSVIGGTPVAPLQFVTVPPCRLVDTRQTDDPIQGGTSRNFAIPQLGDCNIPDTAAAYALNVTVVPQHDLGYLTIWPTGEGQPLVSTMNSFDGRVKANAAIVPGGYQGMVSVYASDTTQLILDINGYFIPAESGTLQFYPLAPCRLVDTRNANGDLGGPFLNGGQPRNFPLLEATGCIPQGTQVKAYSLNFTAIPHPSGQELGYLTAWPEGQSQPQVSTLNNPTATYVANAAIIPAGTGGGVSVYVDQSTDLAIDINGYFALAGSGGLSFYPSVPCRVIDTRTVGSGQPFSGNLTVNVAGSVCAPPAASRGYVFNATVVPSPSLSYLTLWPDSQGQPTVSTLNAVDGFVTSNMAIVPNVNGKIDAYAAGMTQLILDISGYFAPQ